MRQELPFNREESFSSGFSQGADPAGNRTGNLGADTQPSFSFTGSIRKCRIVQSKGFEQLFEDHYFIQHFGYLHYIEEPFRHWVKKAVHFYYLKKDWPEVFRAPGRLSVRFQYLLNSDRLGKKMPVEHLMEAFIVEGHSSTFRPEHWEHKGYLKKRQPLAPRVEFRPQFFWNDRRMPELEKELREFLSDSKPA